MAKYLDLDDVAAGNPVAQKELRDLRDENSDLRFRLQDWHDSAESAWKSPCDDEQHCTCVPLLRKTCDELKVRSEAAEAREAVLREALTKIGSHSWCLSGDLTRNCEAIAQQALSARSPRAEKVQKVLELAERWFDEMNYEGRGPKSDDKDLWYAVRELKEVK